MVLRSDQELFFRLFPGLFRGVLLSSQFWPMWSKSRQGLGQLPIGRTTLSGWIDGWGTVSHSWSPFLTSTASAKIGKTALSRGMVTGPNDQQIRARIGPTGLAFEHDPITILYP